MTGEEYFEILKVKMSNIRKVYAYYRLGDFCYVTTTKGATEKDTKRILDKMWSITLEHEGSLSAKATELTFKEGGTVLLLTPADKWVDGKLGQFGKFEVIQAMYAQNSASRKGRG
jgi:hypothetical protein